MPDVNGVAGERLRSFIERIERLEEEKRGIAEDIKEVYAEAKGTGFDTKTIREIVKLRRLTDVERAEREALLDIYKAALGMLDGTPLGEAAIRRLSKKPDPESPPSAAQPSAAPEMPEPEMPEPEKPADNGPTIDEAREMGAAAAADSKPVIANPFPARDPRRAAWDEAWCAAAGSDGMEVPEAWRRAKNPKPDPAPAGAP